MPQGYNSLGVVASMEDGMAGRSDELQSLMARDRERSGAARDRERSGSCRSCCVGCGRCIYRESMQAVNDLRHATPGQ